MLKLEFASSQNSNKINLIFFMYILDNIHTINFLWKLFEFNCACWEFVIEL